MIPDSLWPHGPQNTRLQCFSISPSVCSNSCTLIWWCPLTISSSVTPFSSCPQSFPASGSFPVSRPFTSGGQRIGASASASVFQWICRVDFLYDWLVWSPCYPRDSQESFLGLQLESINSLALSLYGPTLISVYDHWKKITSTTGTFVGKVMSLPLFFNMLFRFVIAFLPKSILCCSCC